MFFYCEVPAASGGGTGVTPSWPVYEALAAAHPAFLAGVCKFTQRVLRLKAYFLTPVAPPFAFPADCLTKGVAYRMSLPEEADTSTGVGRSWKRWGRWECCGSTSATTTWPPFFPYPPLSVCCCYRSFFGVDSRAAAEARMAALGYSAQWDAAVPGLLHLTTPVLPAVWEGSDKTGLGGPGRALLLSGVTVAEGGGGLAALLAPAAGKRRSFFNQLVAQARGRRGVSCVALLLNPRPNALPSQVLGNAAEFEKQRAAATPALAAAVAGGDDAAASTPPAYVTFGDGSPVPVEPLLTAAAAADGWGVDVEVSGQRGRGRREVCTTPLHPTPLPLPLGVRSGSRVTSCFSTTRRSCTRGGA